jgi:hypothetical protein
MYTHRHLGVRDEAAHLRKAPQPMTRDPVVGRGTRAIDAIRRLDPGTILALILVLGLVLRVLIAGVYLPKSGLANDIGAFTAWANRLAALGPGEFYAADYFADYPPGYLYVLWFLGIVGGALQPLFGANATSGLVKIPGILADIGVAWMLFVIARRWAPTLVDRTRFRIGAETLGLAAATVYLFSPGVIFDSAVWGQIDSVGTFVLLATIYALGRGWIEAAAFGAILAMLVKFQFAFLIPVVILVGLKRHLFGRSSDPAHAGGRPRPAPRPHLPRGGCHLARGAHAAIRDVAVLAVHHARRRGMPGPATGRCGHEPDRQVLRGNEHLHRPDRERVQPVAEPGHHAR